MKNAIFTFILVGPTVALAACNLKLAMAAGTFLAELEKLSLTKYQDNNVCEVLNYEFWSCSKEQQSQLKKTFNLNEVLFNYCQPHLPAPQPFVKDSFMKGADFYSWKDFNGYIWFALLPGTNAQKTTKEITNARLNWHHAKELLVKLPMNTIMSWNNLATVSDKEKLQFMYPPKELVTEIKMTASSSQVDLQESR